MGTLSSASPRRCRCHRTPCRRNLPPFDECQLSPLPREPGDRRTVAALCRCSAGATRSGREGKCRCRLALLLASPDRVDSPGIEQGGAHFLRKQRVLSLTCLLVYFQTPPSHMKLVFGYDVILARRCRPELGLIDAHVPPQTNTHTHTQKESRAGVDQAVSYNTDKDR